MYQLRGAGRIIAEQTAIVNVRPIATTGPATNSSSRNSSCCETTSTFTVSLNDFNRPPTRSLPRVVSDASETYYRRVVIIITTKMWDNAQCDGRPAEYRWRRMLNAAKFG